MVIICDISAWQYWRTPPIVRDVEIPVQELSALYQAGLGFPPSLLSARANAREADLLVQDRLLSDLKGLTLPVHVMVDDAASFHRSELIHPHRIPRALPRDWIHDLGCGLFVLSPELAVATHTIKRSTETVAKMAFEACGIFTIRPATERVDLVIGELDAQGALDGETDGIYGYSDAQGRPNSPLDSTGEELSWSPCRDRFGKLTSMWKRPPLTSIDRIAEAARDAKGVRGVRMARRALSVCRDGAASPAEVYANLLLCSGTWFGGESWGDPQLNRRIPLTPEAQRIYGRAYCIADMTWDDRLVDLEVGSLAHHADTRGYRTDSARRAALECMGYEIPEINIEQMEDLELFDAMLPALAKRTGFSLQPRTPAFLKRRDHLHDELFREPYEPDRSS